MVLRIKNFNTFGVHWKIWLLEGGSPKTNIWGELSKKGGASTVCWFTGGLVRKRTAVFLRGVDAHMFKILRVDFLLDWIGAPILSLLLKLPPRKLEPWFILWRFFFLTLLCISINLLYCHAWNIAVMSGLVLLAET